MRHLINILYVLAILAFSVTSKAQETTPQNNEIPIIKPQVKIEKDYVRFLFSGKEAAMFDAAISGETIILSFNKQYNLDFEDIAYLKSVIKSIGVGGDGKTYLIKTTNKPEKIRKFISDGSTSGFDLFTEVQLAAGDVKQNRIFMTPVLGAPEDKTKVAAPKVEVPKEIKNRVSSKASERLIPLIVTYPQDFVGPPKTEQLYRDEKSFVGPLPADHLKYSFYEVIKFKNSNLIDAELLVSKNSATLLLPFNNPETISAAALKKGSDVMVLVDGDRSAFIKSLPKNEFISSIKTEKIKGATVFLVKLNESKKKNYEAYLYRDKQNWILEVYDKNEATGDYTIKPINIKTEDYFGANRVIINTTQIKGPFEVLNPNTGLNYKIFATNENANGVPLAREFVDLEIPQTLQGVFISEKSDLIKYEVTNSSKVIVGKLTNLLISPEIVKTDFAKIFKDGNISKVSGIFTENSIFPFKKKDKKDDEKETKAELDATQDNAGEAETADVTTENDKKLNDFNFEKSSEMIRRIVESEKKEKTNLKLKLANYYFANGMYIESSGILKDTIIEDPSNKNIFQIKATYAATLFLSRKYEEATEAFDDLISSSTNSSAFNEIKLWQWASRYMHNKTKRLNEEVNVVIDFISSFDKFMQDYPDELRYDFGEMYVTDKFENDKFEEARSAMEVLNFAKIPSSRVNDNLILQGKISEQSGDFEVASDSFKEVLKDSSDRKNRAKAMFEITKIKLKQNKIGYLKAIDSFLQAATVWRDDYFEMDVFEEVGDLYLQNKQYIKALDVWKTLAVNFPNTPESVMVLGKMKTIFIDLFDKGDAYKLPPIEALEIYFKFRDLLPVGQTGDIIIRKIARFFLDADMVDDATGILKHQIKFRAKDDDRANLILWLSEIYLENRNPDDAILALESIPQNNISPEIFKQRTHALAMAYTQNQDYEKAIELVRDDDSPEANDVRIEVFWKKENWFGLINLIEPRLDSIKDTFPEPLTKKELGQITKLATAYAAQGYNDKLIKLKDDFITRVADEKHLQALEYLFEARKKLDFKYYEDTLGLKSIENFMNKYSFLPMKYWESSIKILEPRTQEYKKKNLTILTDEQRIDVIELAIAYAMFESEDVKVKDAFEKKLKGLARDFKDVTVDRVTIDAFKILDDKLEPKDADAVFEGKIKILDIPKFLDFYNSTKKFSELNISIRNKF